MKYYLVIPARYNSRRLQGKPLLNILGIPMILRTYNQCKKVVQESKILIATDDIRIKKICEINKIKVVMTSKKCLTGTDRISEVAKSFKADFYLNIQGDEPICNPSDIKKLIIEAKKNPNTIINGYTEIKDKELFYSEHIPKVVFRKDGRLLYQSRAPIPGNKKTKLVKSWRQVCVYSLPYRALKAFSSIKKKHNWKALRTWNY
ncbi:3-deoxy-manno-octulosonate cytidylyltransferase [Candidatus Pelagibacter sp. IMCC9063]|uniref:cytidylyltransferase domain-containing protein n=1 Tax=Pelagibacter sp. (strain IMCC9063) TaxID=1002672 RepID=UPI00020464BD|nr:3-deoxy-manno-octulosonate cytidylyltransferase [Candidatus Pelagibacter sp. IMCC9063]AEA80559.1 3-deoxy-manno-octulosonate cytidylyltransferase [Candidatus Pelagibacter sp. IMCC9063]